MQALANLMDDINDLDSVCDVLIDENLSLDSSIIERCHWQDRSFSSTSMASNEEPAPSLGRWEEKGKIEKWEAPTCLVQRINRRFKAFGSIQVQAH
jgi:hypothetical protein